MVRRNDAKPGAGLNTPRVELHYALVALSTRFSRVDKIMTASSSSISSATATSSAASHTITVPSSLKVCSRTTVEHHLDN